MPYNSITEARDAMQSMFATAWNAQTPPVPVLAYDDKPFTTPPGTHSWARVSIIHNKGIQATLGAIGSRRFRKLGIIVVQIFSPSGGGLTVNDALVKIAIDTFEGKNTKPDGVTFLNVRSQEIGTSGSWFQTNVTSQFEYDIIK